MGESTEEHISENPDVDISHAAFFQNPLDHFFQLDDILILALVGARLVEPAIELDHGQKHDDVIQIVEIMLEIILHEQCQFRARVATVECLLEVLQVRLEVLFGYRKQQILFVLKVIVDRAVCDDCPSGYLGDGCLRVTLL